MARRNRDKSFKQSQKGKLKRSENGLDQKALVILACEGEKTERFYFETLFKKLYQHLSKASCVIAKHEHTNPTGVLKDLLSYRDISTGNTYKTFEHRWIVIDRDAEKVGGGGNSVNEFNSALSQANAKSVRVAYSNPCFELWFLLHFDYINTPLTRDEAQKRLSRKLGVQYRKSSATMFDVLEPNLGNAIRNAERLFKQMENDGVKPVSANPSSTVFQLLCTLICPSKNQKIGTTCTLTDKSCFQSYRVIK